MTGAAASPRRLPGDGWDVGADGLPYRRAARVILVDNANRLLLVRGHDPAEPARHWWFTLGGGIDPGESPAQAAVREVREEAGLELVAADLIGPVLTRSAVFDFFARTVRQDEEFYFARTSDAAPVATHGWTAIEREFLDEVRWWSLPDLARVEVEVFPFDLAAMTASLLTGWDGVRRHVDESA